MTEDDRYLELDVSSLPHDQQFAAWAGTQHPFKVSPAVSTSAAAGFRAVARAWLLPPLIVSEAELGAFSSWRTHEDCADGHDGVTFQLFLEGGMDGIANGFAFTVPPGEIALQDASLPFAADVLPSHTVVVTMPRATIDEHIDVAAYHGRVLTGSFVPVLKGVMRSLPEALSSEGREPVDDLAAIISQTLALVLRQMPAIKDKQARSIRGVRLKVRRYVARNLAKDLSIATLCQATGASRSMLYRAFHDDGGVAGYVKLRRLLKLRKLLADSAEQRPIATLAALYGFFDPSHFNREFRRTFKATPGAVRRGARCGSVGEVRSNSVQDSFLEWVANSEKH